MKYSFLLFIICCLSFSISHGQEFEFERSLKGHNASVSYVTFRSEDNLIVSGDEDGEVIIWDISTGKKLHQINDHKGLITHITFNNQGNQLATASYDGTIRLYDFNPLKLVKVIRNTSIGQYDGMNGNEPSFITYAPNDRGIFYGGYNLEVLYTDLKKFKSKRVFKSNSYAITCGQISSDKKYLAIGYGHNIRFINLKNYTKGFELKNPQNDDHFICEIAFQPETKRMAAWNYSGTLQLWDIPKRKVQLDIPATAQEGTSNMAFSGSGQFLVTGNFGKQTKLWDIHDNRIIQILGKHRAEVVTFAYSVDGNYIVTGSKDKIVNVWKRRLPDQEDYSDEFDLFDEAPAPNLNQPKIVFIDYDAPKNENEQINPSNEIKEPEIVAGKEATDEQKDDWQTEELAEAPEVKEESEPYWEEDKNDVAEDTFNNAENNSFEQESNDNNTSNKNNENQTGEEKITETPEKVKPAVPIKDRPIETQHEVRVKSREIVLSFWDNQKVDGDSISVSLNGKWILSNYSLKKRKKSVRVTLEKDKSFLIIHAHNEGSISPNTLSLRVSTDFSQKIYSLNSDMKKSGALKIVYDP